jgi:hypothetical protein
MTKNHRFAFAVVAVLLLLFVSLQGQISQLYAAEADLKQKTATAYPETPEGVVEAFVKVCLEDVILPKEELLGYYVNQDYEKSKYFIEETPGWDCFDVGTGYEIKEVKKGKKKASVKVLYKRLGRLCDDYYIRGTKKPRTRAKEQEEYNHLLYMTNDTEEVRYSLVREKDVWLIKSEYYPTYISVNGAIKRLEYRMTKYHGTVKTEPSEMEKEEIKRIIKLLEDYLKYKK